VFCQRGDDALVSERGLEGVFVPQQVGAAERQQTLEFFDLFEMEKPKQGNPTYVIQ
jgi:hypothetical protein